MSEKTMTSTGIATITPKGIRFQNLYYTCPRVIRERWFEESKIYGAWKVKVSYNPVNLKLIFIEGAVERHQYMMQYVEHFYRKWKGEI